MLLVFESSYIRKIRNARTQKSRDTGEHTNTSASYNKGENKKIASDFDACYPILFRKVYIVKMLDAHIAMRKDYALYLRIYADTFLNKAISPSDYQYERNESLSDDELLYYNEIQEILKSINAQMSKHEIDHCKGIVI